MKDSRSLLCCPFAFAIVVKVGQLNKFVVKLPQRPDFVGWKREVTAYASRILSRFVGEAREEVETIFDALQAELSLSATIVRRAPTMWPERARQSLQEFIEAIPDLHRYGVEDTEPLEKIERELRTWLRQHGQDPGNPSPGLI